MSKATQKKYREHLINTRSTYSRLRLYGITQEQYDLLFIEQYGRCAICGTKAENLSRALVIDHDHATGKVRGLLCDVCNSGLGFFKDSRFILKYAIRYLGKAEGLAHYF